MRKKVVNKETITEMAEKLIREEGLDKCSMRRISKELGIAVGTVFNYFESRERLLEAVFTSSWSKTADRIESVTAEEISTMDSLRRMTEIILEDIANRGGIGGQLMISDSDFWVRGRAYLEGVFSNAFTKLLEKDQAIAEPEKLGKWLHAVIFMCIKEYKGVSEMDWKRIEKILY